MNKPTFWRLFGAYTIDLIAFCILFVISGILIWSPLFDLSNNWLWQYCVVVGSFLLSGAVYFALTEGIKMQSVGKYCFHLKIVKTRFTLVRILVAYGVDVAILFIIKNAFELTLPLEAIKNDTLFLGAVGGFYILFFLFAICYFAVSEKYWGKSLGKKIAGLTVVEETK